MSDKKNEYACAASALKHAEKQQPLYTDQQISSNEFDYGTAALECTLNSAILGKLGSLIGPGGGLIGTASGCTIAIAKHLRNYAYAQDKKIAHNVEHGVEKRIAEAQGQYMQCMDVITVPDTLATAINDSVRRKASGYSK